jgi:ATP-dependent Clp protease protease subunit
MILKIYNAIMSEEERQYMMFMGVDGVSFNSIDEFIESIPEDDDTIDMRLNSPGGIVSEGWAIIDKLRATGKKIIATIEGEASSMAAIILLAASERKGYKHARLLIHDAYFPEYTLSGKYRKEDLEKLANSLDDDNQRALDFMVERTGADRETLEAIMKEDTPMDMEKAKELGFIHEIIEPASASSKGWKRPTMTRTTTNSSDMENKKTLASAFKAFAEALGLSVKMEDAPAPVGYVLTAQDGTEINIDKPEGEDPAVGDSATPDGEFLMPDGTTIVVADGVITEIRDAEPEKDPEEDPAEDEAHKAEIEAKDAEIADLQERIKELEANQMTDEQKDIVAKVEKAGGKAWLDKSLKSNYKPAARDRRDQTVEPKASKTATDLAAVKARRAARSKKSE